MKKSRGVLGLGLIRYKLVMDHDHYDLCDYYRLIDLETKTWGKTGYIAHNDTAR